MASQGPLSPGTMANDTSVGSSAWFNVDNAKVHDTSRAQVGSVDAVSNYIKATNFGFTIPAGATINGILVEIEKAKFGAGGGTVVDTNVNIVKADGSIGTTNKADTVTAWPAAGSEAYISYGGSGDTWGESWTADNINDVDFGTAMSCTVDWTGGGPISGQVNHMRITVYYTESGTDVTVSPSAQTVTSSQSDPTVTALSSTFNGYNGFKKNIQNGSIDLDTNTIKAMLVNSTYTFDPDNHIYASDITGEITGTGYDTGGKTLTGLAVSQDNGNNQSVLTANNLSWSTATFTARGAVIYRSTGVASTSPLISYFDFGGNQSPSTQNFNITWNASGIIRF